MAEPRSPQRAPQASEQRSEQKPKRQIRTALNRYEINESLKPPGMAYEWKRVSVMGQEDVEHQINNEINGWTPVPAERHPEMSGTRLQAGSSIVRNGLMLMERPEEIQDEARVMDAEAAQQQVQNHVKRMNLQASNVPGAKGIKTTYQPILD